MSDDPEDPEPPDEELLDELDELDDELLLDDEDDELLLDEDEDELLDDEELLLDEDDEDEDDEDEDDEDEEDEDEEDEDEEDDVVIRVGSVSLSQPLTNALPAATAPPDRRSRNSRRFASRAVSSVASDGARGPALRVSSMALSRDQLVGRRRSRSAIRPPIQM